jgi:hypothetical protein
LFVCAVLVVPLYAAPVCEAAQPVQTLTQAAQLLAAAATPLHVTEPVTVIELCALALYARHTHNAPPLALFTGAPTCDHVNAVPVLVGVTHVGV